MIRCFSQKMGAANFRFQEVTFWEKLYLKGLKNLRFVFPYSKKFLIVFCNCMAKNAQIYIKRLLF